MDFEKFEQLKQKNSDALTSYRSAVARARASVEFAEAMIKNLAAERLKVGGVISRAAADERQRIDLATAEWRAKLKERRNALAAAQGVDTDVINKIAKRMGVNYGN